MYATKKPDKVNPNKMRLSKWLNCPLSNEPLKWPVVIDKLGNLFNKEALVEALLMKTLPKEFGYIKGLKDMIVMEPSLILGFEGKHQKGSGAKGYVGLLRLSGTKHRIDNKSIDNKAMVKVDGNEKVNVNGKVEHNGKAKRFKAVDIAPLNATKEIYASIFTSLRKSDSKETYSCRSLPLGRN